MDNYRNMSAVERYVCSKIGVPEDIDAAMTMLRMRLTREDWNALCQDAEEWAKADGGPCLSLIHI